MRLGPVGFLFGTAAAWAVARTFMLWPSPEDPSSLPKIIWASPFNVPARTVRPDVDAGAIRAGVARPLPRTLVRSRHDRPLSFSLAPAARQSAPLSPFVSPIIPPSNQRAALPVGNAVSPKRWSVSAWMLVRGDGAPTLATGGQLAGSQAGFRARYRLSDHVHLAGRVSSPLQIGSGKELSLALDVRPLPRLPLTLTVERRIGVDAGGRNALAFGAFGGFDLRPTRRIIIDGYAQAGLVGLNRRDAYVDGSLRAEHALLTRSGLRLGGGVGLWGGAQPGVSRLDVGPQLVAHVPVAQGGIRIGAEWRQRVAGEARPGSGPVLSLGADF